MDRDEPYGDRAEAYGDRAEAGRRLAVALAALDLGPGAIVLALPRGGVPVGFEVASELGLPLDVWLVRKLGAPFQTELALGAIASGGVRVLNEELVTDLGITREQLDEIAAPERRELERRERAYRGDRPAPELAGRPVVLVDDGLATGATMLAALRSVRARGPARIVVAAPVGPASTVARLRDEADEAICPLMPADFFAIGGWYASFPQLRDEEVREILVRARGESAPE